MASGTVSTTLSEWLVVLLIVFTLIIEFILHRIEHWVKARHHHLGPALRVLYRELMILGLVSFLFIIYETVEKPKGDIILSFEFAHVFIFLLALFYAIVVLSTMFTSLRLSARWKKMEQIDLVNYLLLKDTYTGMKARHDEHPDPAWRLFLWWFPNVFKLVEYVHLHEVMAFHDIRFQFIYYRNLPDQFRFSSFLRKVKASTFNELIESHWSLYVIFLVVVAFDIIRRHATNKVKPTTDTLEPIFLIAASIVLAFFVQVLAVKIRRVYWQLTRHPRIYFESVEAAAVQAELLAAEQRMTEHRTKRRSIDRPRPTLRDTGNDADDEAARPSPETPAEIEMLEPMRANPIKNPVLSSRADSDISAAPVSMTSDVTMAANTNPVNLNDRNRAHAAANPDEDLHQVVMNHGMQGSASNDIVHTAANDHLLDDPENNPSELRATAERHSLDVALRGAAPPSSGTVRRSAAVAQSAIEAARKRAAEMDPMMPAVPIEQDIPVRPPRRVRSAAMLSALGSQRTSMDDEAATSSIDRIRASLDGQRRSIDRVRGSVDNSAAGRRRSVELAVAIKRDELAATLGSNKDGGAHTVVTLESESEHDRSRRQGMHAGKRTSTDTDSFYPKMFKDRDEHFELPIHTAGMNGTILTHLENQRNAENAEPLPWPRFLVKLIPRLGRVASPAEKLFWFGSHKFFLWCVEFVLFFSTVVMAAATAVMSLLPLTKREIDTLNILALVFATLNLLFVLFRIAGIIKKYIFILHNASLIPEIVAIEAIHTVSQKSAAQRRVIDRDNISNASGSETEMEEDESARERRRKLGRFFRSEVTSGNVKGIEGGERTSTDGGRKLRWRRRRAARRRDAGDEDEDGIEAVQMQQGKMSLESETPEQAKAALVARGVIPAPLPQRNMSELRSSIGSEG